MSRRTERLNRLVIQSPCRTSWEAMDDRGSARFCPRCNKHVHDLAAMEAREVEALVEATHGRFCARLTRDRAGRLVTRPPAPPPVPPADPARRASPVAAVVVGALVGLSGAAWAGAPGPGEPPPAEAPPEPARPAQDNAAGAFIVGHIQDESGAQLPGVTVVARDADHRERSLVTSAEGVFLFEGLPAGVYTVEATLEGFDLPSAPNLVLKPGRPVQLTITGQAVFDDVLVGVVDLEQPLLSAYRQSSLVVIATVGPSLPLSVPAEDSSRREVRTELQVETVLKGTLRGGAVRIDLVEYDGDESLPQSNDTVLAFLTAPEDEPTRPEESLYASVDFGGPRRLPRDALRAYRRQIEALARLGEAPRADELLEWMVETAEDEHTREETVGELRRAVAALEELGEEWARRRSRPGPTPGLDAQAEADRLLARAGEQGDEVEPAVLGALLEPAHQKRLSRALLATERLTQADLDLYDLVRPWAGEAARRWLAERLADDAAETWAARQAMTRLAEELADDGLQRLLDQADAELEAFYAEPERPGESDEAWNERLAARTEAVEHELRRDFLRALGGRP